MQYASPQGELVRRPITSIRQTITLTAICAILFGELMYVVPRMEQVFRDFKVDLAWPARWAVNLSHFTRENVIAWPIFIAIPLFVPMLTTSLIWRPNLSPTQYRVRQWIFGSLVTMFFALMAVLVMVGLFVGYIGIVNSQMSPGK